MKFFAPLALCLLLVQSASAEIIERIVAIVNDDIITQSDLRKFEQKLKGSTFVDELIVPDEKTKNELLKDEQKLVQKLIEQKLIESEIKRLGLIAPIERVEEKIREIAKANNLTRDQLRAALTERGESFSEYQQFIKDSIERQALIERAVTSKIRISEEDVTSYYRNRHGGQGDQVFEYTISHILFSPSKGGREAARQRAVSVLQSLKDGGNFEKLAADHSEDPNFSSGGLLGTFKSGEFLKELETGVQKLAPGEVSEVVETPASLHIVKVLKKRLIPNPELEKEREQIRNVLFEEAYKKQFRTWLEETRQEAFVRINSK